MGDLLGFMLLQLLSHPTGDRQLKSTTRQIGSGFDPVDRGL